MSILKNEHGTYVVRRRVPKPLQESVAFELANGKLRQAYLQESLRTKDKATAKRLAPAVLLRFDQILAKAEARAKPAPLRDTLTAAELKSMADYHHASVLGNDAAMRRLTKATRRDPVFQSTDAPDFGLSEPEFHRLGRSIDEELALAKQANAQGNISFLAGELDELQELFRVRLDNDGAAYRALGRAVLARHVEALQALQRRHSGEPVATPPQPPLDLVTPSVPQGDGLRAAFEGWRKHQQPSARTADEFDRAIRLFTELHGDLPVAAITPRHADQFREALQNVPRKRAGPLLTMSLPQLVEWTERHPGAAMITAATINKIFGGVQTIAKYAKRRGYIPAGASRDDPFADGRLPKRKATREPFGIADLNTLFRSPIYSDGERPKGGHGEAAFWLPLLGLYTGGRLSELAGLAVADLRSDPASGVTALFFIEDRERGRGLKTDSSERAVPIHPQIVALGFLDYVAQTRSAGGATAWLFPLVAPETNGDKAWSKWFGNYKRGLGITDKDTVFHSLRHAFKDALRRASVPEERSDALTGHASTSVGRMYGAKAMMDRFGWKQLADDVARVSYPGLDLSHIPTTE